MLVALLPTLFWLLAAAALLTIAIIGIRALLRIDRSLQALVEQGVARGEGPFDTPPA